jgi:hypothetical protein
MRKNIFQSKILNTTGIFLFIFFLLSACSKHHNNSNSDPSNPLVGTWYSDSAFDYSYNSSTNTTDKGIIYNSPFFYNEQYIQFKANDTAFTQGIDLTYYALTGGINLIYSTIAYKFYNDSVLIENFNSNRPDTLILSFTSSNSFIMHTPKIQPYTNGYTEVYFFR